MASIFPDQISQAAVDGVAFAGTCAYYRLPAESIRHFCDGMFPLLAKCPQADLLAGNMHRWKGGHDLILDVARTASNDGAAPAAKQFGHILLTDAPTKAGIPIPGFSGTGLGKCLVELGIPKGWLCINVVDGVVGVLALAEGFGDLRNAIAGQLQMDSIWSFYDTFGEGTVEVCLAVATKNPLLLVAGVENILAGIIAAVNSVKAVVNPFYYVNPYQFFGNTLGAALIGFAVGQFVLGQTDDEAFVSALKSGAVSAFFLISPYAAYGIMTAFAMEQLAIKAAKADEQELLRFLQWDFASVCAFLGSAEALHTDFASWYRKGLDGLKKSFLSGDAPLLEGRFAHLPGDVRLLEGENVSLEGVFGPLRGGGESEEVGSAP